MGDVCVHIHGVYRENFTPRHSYEKRCINVFHRQTVYAHILGIKTHFEKGWACHCCTPCGAAPIRVIVKEGVHKAMGQAFHMAMK